MIFINKILSAVKKGRLADIERYSIMPVDIQRKQLSELLRYASKTEYGKKYDFKNIYSYTTFSRVVPISTYENFRPLIDRMLTGESDILWPGTVRWFAKSSGTTGGKSKFIPISAESLDRCHYQGAQDLKAIYFRNFPRNKIFPGKSLILGGSHDLSNKNYEINCGDLSAVLLSNLPNWTNLFRTPDSETVLLSNFEEKVRRIASQSVKENVTSFVGVPSWLLVLMNHILKEEGKSDLHEIWPNLELFVHGGINFDPYREEYKKIISSPDMRYMETYNASEGFFAIQDDPSIDGMLLLLDLGIFYEFIPLSILGSSSEKAIPIWEVEKGVNYAMVITTTGGLWRYLIGDTVQFVTTSPYRVVITGRTAHFINAFGEELIIDNAIKGLKIACDSCNVSVLEFTAGPVYMTDSSKGRHQWIIEFAEEPQDIELFADVLDRALQDLNSDYEAKRYNNTTLDRLELIPVKRGVFNMWMDSRGKLGGQNKVPRLANNRNFLDSILEFISDI